MEEKRIHGQYFTKVNPFSHPLFKKWFDFIPKETILEPFAGANNLVLMINKLYGDINWDCFDINPPTSNEYSKYKVIKRNTLENYPKNYNVVITNPPYLAKNSAKRRKIDYQGGKFEDLYQKCLDVMLANNDYVAAIVPESFITQKLFFERLYGFISLNKIMFDDTQVPVCLILFVKNTTNDFEIWSIDEYLGTYNELKNYIPNINKKYDIKFNDPNGILGIKTIDGILGNSIEFIQGNKIESNKIKISSRAFSRISSDKINENNLNKIINKSNLILKKYREHTKDVFMTSFKGLRKDGKYRRRIDFATVKNIINNVIEDLEK